MKWQMISINKSNNNTAHSIMNGIGAGCALCSAGMVEIKVNDNLYSLEKNQLFIYPPYAKIEITAVSQDFECIVFDIDHQFLLNTLKSVSWSNKLHLIANNPIASLSDYYKNRLSKLIDLVFPVVDNIDNHLEFLATECMKQALTYEVLAAFTEHVRIPEETKSSKDTIVLEFQAMLKQKCLLHRDVEYYASMQCLTPRYFSTVIREMTGNTASYWIINAVIVEAQHLMLDYSQSLKEITFKLNFSSQTFFSRWYKRYTGETPTEFRKRNRI